MAKKGQKLEITLHRESKAWQMRIDGFTQREIANELGIAQQSVCALLKSARDAYHAEFMQDIDCVKQEQVMSIMQAAREAMNSWRLSKACGPGADAQYNQFGDTRYLKIYLSCLSEIRKILGADEAIKFDMELDVKSLSTEQLRRIVDAKTPNCLSDIVQRR